MQGRAVITGIGMVTPLGAAAHEVLSRIAAGEQAARPAPFDTSALACKQVAMIEGFDAQRCLGDTKTLRLMSRDAQLAVVAARAALADAGVRPDVTHAGDRIGLFGATGLTGMPADEVASLVRHCADPAGRLDLKRFGQVTLRRVRPVLSFKILANMPICFVSIFCSVRGENAVYSPWEGHGAQAIAAAARAIEAGRCDCALAGGCDVRTHEFAAVSLQQLGATRSWASHGRGSTPGEGAAFVVLEEARAAASRGARVYARLADYALATAPRVDDLAATAKAMLAKVRAGQLWGAILAADGDPSIADAEAAALGSVSTQPVRAQLSAAPQSPAGSEPATAISERAIHPKRHLGNLYAAAAAVQVGLAAAMASGASPGRRVLASCLGFGSQQGAFVLEGA